MTDAALVSLVPASSADATLLSNLLELYIHDLSAMFPNIALGSDGRFGYPRLPLYWSEPERRFAFILRAADGVVGFALVTRGSPALPDPELLDVAEFFVLRRHRRSGVGRAAAFALWRHLPGKWTVRASQGNPDAVVFWRRVVGEFSGGGALELELAGAPHPWCVFSFDSGGEASLALK
jgi:predicted acetyltransferase